MDLIREMIKVGEHAKMRDSTYEEIQVLDRIIEDKTKEIEAYILHDSISIFTFEGVVQTSIPDTIFGLWCHHLYSGCGYSSFKDNEGVDWAVGEVGGFEIKTKLTPYRRVNEVNELNP
jgi:hypothetical protein